MLRASLIAIVAVSLAACDDESETVVEETGTDVEVTAEETTTEVEEVTENTVDATEDTVETAAAEVEEAGETAGAALGEATGEQAAAEDEEGVVLTSDSPAVETTILTEADSEQVSSDEVDLSTGEDAETDDGANAGGTAEGDDADGEGTELAAAETDTAAEAETDAEPTAGEESDAMQRYQDWVQGRWAQTASCESGIIEMQENAISLPGNVTCSEIEVAGMGSEALAVTGSSCEGTGDLDEVELEVTQTDDGITVARDGQEASLVRCD